MGKGVHGRVLFVLCSFLSFVLIASHRTHPPKEDSYASWGKTLKRNRLVRKCGVCDVCGAVSLVISPVTESVPCGTTTQTVCVDVSKLAGLRLCVS